MQSNNKTAMAVGTGSFLTVFAALCVTFDPMTAFALSLVVLVTVKGL